MAVMDEVLSRSTLSQMLGEDSHTTIEQLATRAKFQKNEVVFFQNDPGDAFYIVEEGRVEISVMSVNGRKLTLNEMRPGDIFGEIAALDGGPRTATATALVPSLLARVGRRELMTRVRESGVLGITVIEILCARLRWISQQVEHLALHDIESRLASKLLLLHERFADDCGALSLSQNELADFIGGTRESTNKVLRQWQNKGVIELSRRSILVRDYDRLVDISNG